MADTEYKRLIQVSKDRALFGFLAVAQRAIQDAERAAADQQSAARSGADRTALAAVRHFLRQDSAQLLRRAEALYRGYLDRAFQTMYVDLRPGMRKLSADELTLIDDEVVNHQIEVGRLAERIREANEETIGRLNVIVAQLHGQTEARERENPFRPYLVARALYEAVKDAVSDDARARTAFELLSAAALAHLPGFYQSVRDAFGSLGVQGKFVMQRSRNPHNPRHYQGPTAEAAMARLMPGLQRLVETLQVSHAAAPSGGIGTSVAAGGGQQPDIQDFIRRMFSGPRGLAGLAGGNRPAAPPVNPLVAELGRHQKQDPGADIARLRESLSLDKASMMERMTVDVVSMLFDFIREDDKIPVAQRQAIARLQIPLLKAAVLEPDLLHDEGHPARQLLNRLSSAAAAADPSDEGGRAVGAEIGRVVQRVLDEFDTDCAVFADCLQAFDRFMSGHLRQDDTAARRATEAVEAAERFSILLTRTTGALCDVLLPMNVDKRISDFIIHAWPHVLVHASWQDVEAGRGGDHPQSLYRQYHAVLADLVWSVQDKQTPPERNALIRLLPDLVRRLRGGLALIQMEESESKSMLDLLMDMHTQILRGAAGSQAAARNSLEELRGEFARVVVNWERASWEQAEPPQPRASLIEEVFARRGVAAELRLDAAFAGASADEREFLARTWLLGTRVAFAAPDGQQLPGRLVWISTHRSLYLFRREGGELTLYTYASLLEALRDESLAPVEYAPVFERAVESLLFGAGRLAQPA
ncbi:DUF1631 family protein [Noviherbaspirillum aridicola]|uniref:Thymidine phosphorylase n=1 Tax=Noviherbaspirillum aridicola TaxID=2849687 RepID=A0ABQ4Q395_9BURK|nr:DUF1631 family protein [Noviherbaspirillum aridicola]GIZ51661.1 hypothetical protein NCCP691_16750 [Noviherbaspirillum aridicola]